MPFEHDPKLPPAGPPEPAKEEIVSSNPPSARDAPMGHQRREVMELSSVAHGSNNTFDKFPELGCIRGSSDHGQVIGIG
jgi:hypothetical protein